MFDLSKEIVRVDWNAIRKDFTNVKYWSDSYVLFDCNEVTVTCSLDRINTKSKTLCFELEVNYNNISYHTEVPLQIETFDIDVFENIINKKIEMLIKWVGERRAKAEFNRVNDNDEYKLIGELEERFDYLIEDIDFGEMGDYIDIDDLKYDFVDNHNYYIRQRESYKSNNSKRYVSTELQVFGAIKEAINNTIPGCKVELDLEFIEELELEL